MSVWSFLRRLFGRKARVPARPTPAPAPADHGATPVVDVAPAQPEPPPVPQPTDTPLEPTRFETEQHWADEAEAEAEAEDAEARAGAEAEAQPEADEQEGEEEEEADDEEEEEEFDAWPDPYIHEAESPLGPSDVDVAALREQARAEALSGEHKVALSTPAGPGSLAEALNILLEEGRVDAEFVDDASGDPFILYRPIVHDA